MSVYPSNRAPFSWLNDTSRDFLSTDYLVAGTTPEQRIRYVADTAGKRLGKPDFANKFYDYMSRGWYSLASPIWTNYGLNRGLPISCFGSMLDDTMESILQTHAEIGMMSKYGGGTSVYMGNVRGRGSKITDNGTSHGSVHFARLFDLEITVISQGSCYVEGTQVLTNHGFKDFRNVRPGFDLLAQVDEHNRSSFTADYHLTSRRYAGELVCVTGKKRDGLISLKVTPNHRMVLNRRRGSKCTEKVWKDYTEIVTAEDMKLHRDNRLPRTTRTSFVGRPFSMLDRLRIAYQADGRKEVDTRRVRFRFKRQRKIDRLKWILKEMGIDFTETVGAGGVTEIAFGPYPDARREKFSDWIDLAAVGFEWANEFINEMTHWDGSKSFRNNPLYDTTDKENADFVQAVASIADKRTTMGGLPARGNRKEKYRVATSDEVYTSGESVVVTREQYDGMVHCATVPTGRLVVRHNGTVTVCGNSRRGQCAAYWPIDHRDIDDVIGRDGRPGIMGPGHPIQKLSFGVCVTDAWMEDMIAGDPEKRRVWAQVLTSRRNTGYPYLFFTDAANRHAPPEYKKLGLTIKHSQLCTEISLSNSSTESFVCCLSSMNDLYYDEWVDTDAVEVMVYFLDTVMSEFIEKARGKYGMDRAVRFAERQRALGLGRLGWHSYLQSRMIPFESMEAMRANAAIQKTIRDRAMAASRSMAQEYGEPEYLKGSGRRHMTLLAIAPTKSSSTILGQVSEGIEPYTTNYVIKDNQKGKVTFRNPFLDKLINDKGMPHGETWDAILKAGGSVQNVPGFTEEEKKVFRTFAEISSLTVVQQAAQRQRYIDQGQSVNLFIDPNAPAKEVNALYVEAWRLELKSLYYQKSVNAAQQLARSVMACNSCEG